MRTVVLGGGSWGTTLAWMVSNGNRSACLWARDPASVEEIRTCRYNRRYLPDLRLPDCLELTANLQEAVDSADLILVAVPSGAVVDVLQGARPRPGCLAVLATKGLERGTGRRLSECMADQWPTANLCVLSGPNLAGELVRQLPAAAVLAAHQPSHYDLVRERVASPFFRLYSSTDLPGVELGGALKNPIAVAAGISDGLGLGENSKAALLTRGLAEMTRLGVAAGGRAATFSGLSGLGDLLATAHSPLSRNYRLGLALGQGASLTEAQLQVGQTAEGIATAAAAVQLANRLGIEAPIHQALQRLILGEASPSDLVRELMSRPPRSELEEATRG